MEPAQTSPTIPTPGRAVLDDRQRTFLGRPIFAALSTIDPDGAPRQAVIWYRLEDDGRILINSRVGRRWPTNLLRDGRASLAVTDPEDGYAWLGLTGQVDAVDDDPARALADIEALAWRYHPDGPDPADLASYAAYRRITFRIAIDRVHDHLED
ncbi:MAG TPA: pyridoxamine 5'-phosphate oxidase family protein [Candidatus Limnocylindrales bacterium]